MAFKLTLISRVQSEHCVQASISGDFADYNHMLTIGDMLKTQLRATQIFNSTKGIPSILLNLPQEVTVGELDDVLDLEHTARLTVVVGDSVVSYDRYSTMAQLATAFTPASVFASSGAATPRF